jgi:hypothetical protein
VVNQTKRLLQKPRETSLRAKQFKILVISGLLRRYAPRNDGFTTFGAASLLLTVFNFKIPKFKDFNDFQINK